MSNASFSEDEVVFELVELNGGWLDDFGRWNFPSDDKLLDFVKLVRADEREACAQIAFNAKTYLEAAKAIRAREGEK